MFLEGGLSFSVCFVLVLGSGFFPLLSVKICFTACVTQWLMLKSSDVFWKSNSSNFQSKSQEIYMFLWIKITMKAGCVGRPGCDRIIPGCFLGWRAITKRGFLQSLFRSSQVVSGRRQDVATCRLPCWVMCMFCTSVKLMIRLWWENKS